jgi:hypothetical protein
MATLMAASLAAPAFAADSDTTESTTNRSLKVEGTYQAVDIAVVVPSTGTVIVNPYALPVEIAKDSDEKAIKVEGQQIATKPLAIKNKSEVALDINVSATATVKGSLTLAAAPVDVAKETKNAAFVYLDIESSTLAGDDDTVTADAISSAYATQAASWTAYTVPDNDNPEPANLLVLKTSAVSKTGMGTLVASKLDEDDGSWKEYDEGSIAFVGLTGSCAQSPKTAWTTKDGLTATIAFTFTPHVEAESSDDT